MQHLSPHDVMTMFMALATLLGCAKDLNLLRTEMGTVIISSAMFDDLVGWILFSFVLG